MKKEFPGFFSLCFILDTKIEELIWMIVHDYVWDIFFENTTINSDDNTSVASFMDLYNTFVI